MLGRHLTMAGLCAATLILFLLSTPVMRAKVTKHNSPQNTCKQGFVWREAFPGDYVCVVPKTRSDAASDNRLTNSRRIPNCKQGFVWREASPSDLVCVYPIVREQTAEDNRRAPDRRQL